MDKSNYRLAVIVYFGETDHTIPWQTDHLISWRTNCANALRALSKVVN